MDTIHQCKRGADDKFRYNDQYVLENVASNYSGSVSDYVKELATSFEQELDQPLNESLAKDVYWEGYLIDPNYSKTGDYAVLWSYDETYNDFNYYNEKENVYCHLQTDWAIFHEVIKGFEVKDPFGLCPYIEQFGWTYSWYQEEIFDQNGNLIENFVPNEGAITVPNGVQFAIVEPQVYKMNYQGLIVIDDIDELWESEENLNDYIE